MSKHIVFDCDGTLLDTSQYKYTLYDGVKALLLELSEIGSLYVWTARDNLSTHRILKEFGIHGLFKGVCTIEDAHPKPHISGLIELLGPVNKKSVCVIGDSRNDILGAKNFGAKCIGAVWDKRVNAEDLRDLGADFIALKPQNCLEWINNNL